MNSKMLRGKKKKNFNMHILAAQIQFISKDTFVLLIQNYENVLISLSLSPAADYGHYISVKMKAVCLHMLRPIQVEQIQ